MRTVVFIDGGALNKILLHNFSNPGFDHEKFAKEIAGDGDLIRVYYYDSLPWLPAEDDQTKEDIERFDKKRAFLRALEYKPFFQVRKGIVDRHFSKLDDGTYLEEFQQKRVDCMLAVDLVLAPLRMDATNLVLVSGDSDFVHPILVAREHGAVVTVYHGDSESDITRPHADLLKSADHSIQISQELIDRCRRGR